MKTIQVDMPTKSKLSEDKPQDIINYKTNAWQNAAMAKRFFDRTQAVERVNTTFRNRTAGLLRKLANWISQNPVSHLSKPQRGTWGSHHIYNAVLNRLFLQYCQKGDRVLDLGCGSGQLSLFLAKAGCHVISCDISADMLEILDREKGHLPIETLRSDASKIEMEADSVDTVVSRMFLMQFPNWQEILDEMIRVCKPGGTIAFEFYSQDNLALAAETATHNYQIQWDYAATYKREEWQKLAKERSLTLVNLHPVCLVANRTLGFHTGKEGYQQYLDELQSRLINEDVFEFALWFEEQFVRHLPSEMAFQTIVVLKKNHTVDS